MVLWVWLAACGRVEDTAEFACDRDPPLDYALFGEGYMSTHCTGCHSSLLSGEDRVGAPDGVDLETYDGVLLWADRIDARATGAEPTMPPGGGPTEEDIALLEEWLYCDLLPAAAVDSGGVR